MTTTASAPRPDQADVQHLREHGWYLHHHQAFSPDRLGTLDEILDEHLAAKGAALSEDRAGNRYENA
jgi:hypothetical protein